MAVVIRPSPASRTALVYITLGALMVIWTGVWYLYLQNHAPATSQPYYWCVGLLVSGIILVLIGLAVGRLGREANRADLPPPDAPQSAAAGSQAAGAPSIVPVLTVPPTAVAVPPSVPANGPPEKTSG